MLTSRARNKVKKRRGALTDIRLERTISGTAQSWGCVWMTPTMKIMWHVTVGCSMLEPLPQGMHDRRVSSAESEAPQDWPSKLTEDSVATQSLTHVWIRRQGSSAPVHGGICRPAPPVCSRSNRDIENNADHGGVVSRARFYRKRRSAAQKLKMVWASGA